ARRPGGTGGPARRWALRRRRPGPGAHAGRRDVGAGPGAAARPRAHRRAQHRVPRTRPLGGGQSPARRGSHHRRAHPTAAPRLHRVHSVAGDRDVPGASHDHRRAPGGRRRLGGVDHPCPYPGRAERVEGPTRPVRRGRARRLRRSHTVANVGADRPETSRIRGGVCTVKLNEETPYRYRIDPTGDMRVPRVVFASEALLPEAAGDQSLQQVANVAALPGIFGASYAMPGIHWGYGFPIGGGGATDVRGGGEVSPGGVGVDVSFGVRLLVAVPSREEFTSVRYKIMDGLARVTPRGAGKGAIWPMSTRRELDRVLTGDARYVVEQGRGTQRDLDRCEEFGAVADADPGQVSDRAVERGL